VFHIEEWLQRALPAGVMQVYGLLALQSKARSITRTGLQLSGLLSPFSTRRSGL
jgi:hypothetical protein